MSQQPGNARSGYDDVGISQRSEVVAALERDDGFIALGEDAMDGISDASLRTHDREPLALTAIGFQQLEHGLCRGGQRNGPASADTVEILRRSDHVERGTEYEGNRQVYQHAGNVLSLAVRAKRGTQGGLIATVREMDDRCSSRSRDRSGLLARRHGGRIPRPDTIECHDDAPKAAVAIDAFG